MPTQTESPVAIPYSETDTLTAAQVVSWLRGDLSSEAGLKWLQEKIRLRNVNPIPVKNVGRALIFSRIEILNWIQSLERSPRPYPRRTKAQMAARAASARAAKAKRRVA